MRICKKFEGYVNIESGKFAYDYKLDVVCHTDCITSVTRDNIRVFSINGDCPSSSQHMMMHEVTVAERTHPGGWFRHDRVERTNMSCAAHSDGSRRFITCTCENR
ncbi:hypothetical protein PMAYCL1PPCAC_10727 [Pristionchus mayeri]|uniref:Uncharacterized protein n=1 Tax=Pristionchus mayeri TaxID=1317129 RepID=A0AAN5CEE3_9BILA|nr:hypothetical protein PMAYCL1PPCAC_10727 [Pristionchus mayeri]